MMDCTDIQNLRDLPIEGVALRLGMRVVRHKALCPFHDDHHASLSFKPSKNTFRCYVCNARGGTIDLVMRYLRCGFREACRWLAEDSGVTVQAEGADREPSAANREPTFDASRYVRFFEHPWLNDEAHRFLFDERRLDPRVVSWCRLTSWRDRQGTPWLQTPYYDRDGGLVGVQNRNLIRGAMPRFLFPKGAACTVYNLPVLRRLHKGDELWITEGCSDCWAMLSAGHKAIAIPSATLLTRHDAELLSALHSQLSIDFHMYPDRDEPGERLFMQLSQVLPGLHHHQLPPGCKDFGELFAQTR